MIDNKTKIAKIFKEYFDNIVKNLVLLTEKESGTFTENNLSEVDMALQITKQKPP